MFKQLKWCFKIEYILLFLVSVEFLYKHHFLIFGLFLLLLCKGMIIKQAFNVDFLWAFIWGVFYFIFGDRTYSILHVPALMCSFLIGYCMLMEKIDVFRILLVIGVGYGLEGLMTLYFAGGYVSFAIDESSRTIQSIWGSQVGLTAQNAILYLFSGIIVYIIANRNIKLIWKIIAILFELGFVYDSMRIASRSPLLFCPIIIISSLIAYNGRKMRIRTILSFFIIVLVLFILYNINFLGIKANLENSFLFYRITEQADGGAVNNSRFGLQSRFFDVWTLDMFGGLHNKLGYYFHNTWLDMYAFSGIFGFITFIILTIRFVVDFIYVYRRTDSEERSVWTGVFTAFMLPMYFEPHYWGAPAYFAFFFVFYGMLSKRRKLLERKAILLDQQDYTKVRSVA